LLKGFGGVFSAALLCAALCIPACASIPPQPGMLNYVEGQAAIGNQALSPNSAGSVKLAAGESLMTQNGKAELLLTPGVFLRIAGNSQIQMVSPDIANTVLTLQTGRALVEVDRIYTANNVRINENGASVELTKPGLYDFDADHGQIRVFDGKAEAQVGGRTISLNKGHELALNQPGKLKSHGFDQKAYQDDFFRWASLRSSYLAEANVDAARRYANTTGQYAGAYPGYYGAGWYGTGWYWDPWFEAYTFIPGDGIFYSPFGWGFYSPWLAFGAPFYGGFGYYHHFGPGYHSPYAGFGHGFGGSGFAGHAYSVPGNSFRSGGFAGSGGFGGGVRGGGGFGGGGFHGGGGGGRR